MRELTSARRKLTRAQEHFETLNSEIDDWTSSNASSVSIESNAEGTEHRFVVSISSSPDSDRWGCLIGDCAHNLRSALDHIMWEVSDPKKRDSRTEFPIFATPVRTPKGALVPAFSGKIQGISQQPIRDLIEGCQPCNTVGGPPKRGVLWVIHRIDIVDKHHTIVPALLEHVDPTDLRASLHFADDSPTIGPPHHIAKNDQPIGDGDTLLTLFTEGRVEHVESDSQFSLRVGIDVRPLDIELGIPFGPLPALLDEAGRAVENIVATVEAELS